MEFPLMLRGELVLKWSIGAMVEKCFTDEIDNVGDSIISFIWFQIFVVSLNIVDWSLNDSTLDDHQKQNTTKS